MAYEETQKKINIRIREMKNQRQKYETHWRAVRDNELPWTGQGLSGVNEKEVNDGTKKHTNIFSSIPEDAQGVLSAGMHSGLTSPARPWFDLSVSDSDLMDLYQVKLYLDEVKRRMMLVFARSNVYNALHHMYSEMGGYGPALIGIMENFDTVISAVPFTIGEFWLAPDVSGRARTVYREVWRTAGQLVDEFGIQNVSEAIKRTYESGQLEKPVVLCHLVSPNTDELDVPGAKGKEYRSIYFERGFPEGKFLSTGGYYEFPFLTPRWDVRGANVYGYSPGMKVLPDCQMLHKLEKKSLVALDKVIDPPIKSPSKDTIINTMPGGRSNYDPAIGAGTVTFGPLYEIRPDMVSAENKIMRVEQRIRQGLFYDLFLMLLNTPAAKMTATEVIERHEEKLLMLGPVLERVHNEGLTPLIDRTYAIMNRGGLLPEPPKEIQGAELRVQFTSVLATAQKMVGISGLQQFVGFVGNIAAVEPSALDKIDTDELIDVYADALGVPQRILRSDEDVAGVRQQRADAQAQAMQQQSAMNLAQGAKTLSEADTEGNNALTALLGAPSGAQR